MTKTEAKRQFKKHYKAAMKLKEGGKAWEREINQANEFLKIAKRLHQKELKERYSI